FFKLVNEAKVAGATVFLSSHVLSEVEHVCERVGIIRRWKLVKVARLEDLHEIRVRRVGVEFAGGGPAVYVLPAHHIVNLTSHEPTLEETFLAYYEDQPAEARA